MGSTAVADFGISLLLSASIYTLTQIQLAQVYVDTKGLWAILLAQKNIYILVIMILPQIQILDFQN